MTLVLEIEETKQEHLSEIFFPSGDSYLNLRRRQTLFKHLSCSLRFSQLRSAVAGWFQGKTFLRALGEDRWLLGLMEKVGTL